MDDKKFGVIHEIGDYSSFQELDEQQNEQYKQQLINEQQETDEN